MNDKVAHLAEEIYKTYENSFDKNIVATAARFAALATIRDDIRIALGEIATCEECSSLVRVIAKRALRQFMAENR